MKQIYATSNEIDLQMIVGLLESQGIKTRISAEGAGDYFRKLGSDYAITKSVLVSEQDWDKAVKLASENGFFVQNISKRNKTEVIAARVVLIIFAILLIIFFFL